jgi:hypothetical protein
VLKNVSVEPPTAQGDKEELQTTVLPEGADNQDFNVRGFFRLRNVNILDFYYLCNSYMFWSYDHLQADIYLLELTLLTTDPFLEY